MRCVLHARSHAIHQAIGRFVERPHADAVDDLVDEQVVEEAIAREQHRIVLRELQRRPDLDAHVGRADHVEQHVALVVLNGEEPIAALQKSFRGCWTNLGAMAVYGLIFIGLAIVASIPFGLGWLVLGPVMAGSWYASWRETFDA